MDSFCGIIGGMGTVASTVFLNLINDIHQPAKDQDHLNYVVWNNSDVPDRTDYILHPQDRPSPLPVLMEAVKKLSDLGAAFIAIPCNTAHYFWEELEERSPVPILNMIDLVGQSLADQGVETVGLMATSGTIQAGIYHLIEEKYGIKVLLPDAQAEKQIMSLIYDDVKSSQAINYPLYNRLIENFLAQGAERVILGCTELSVVEHSKNADQLSPLTLDSQFILAQELVDRAIKLKADA